MAATAQEDGTMNRLLSILLVAVLVVGSVALWRSVKENTSQPHVPTLRGKVS